MKTIKSVFCLVVSVLFFVSCGSSSSSLSEKSKNKQTESLEKIKQAVHSGEYKINVDRMLPTSGSSQTLTSLYSLEIRNDSVNSYLPYFGRAYNVPYNGESPLIFQEPLSQYKINYKNDKVEVGFSARTTSDNYKFRITIFSNSTASISVVATNRQPISFQGNLISPK